jgi:hypothetical protein
MSTRIESASLAVLTASAVYVGGWATPFPRSFYDSFPGLNRTWVGGDGPFNEHLVRDVGALYLALAVAGVLALVWRERRVTMLVGAGWTVFSAPHLGYHLQHLGRFESVDMVGSVVALGGTLVLAVVLLASTAHGTEVPR